MRSACALHDNWVLVTHTLYCSLKKGPLPYAPDWKPVCRMCFTDAGSLTNTPTGHRPKNCPNWMRKVPYLCGLRAGHGAGNSEDTRGNGEEKQEVGRGSGVGVRGHGLGSNGTWGQGLPRSEKWHAPRGRPTMTTSTLHKGMTPSPPSQAPHKLAT